MVHLRTPLRAEASAPRLAELNPYVNIRTSTCSIGDGNLECLRDFQVSSCLMFIMSNQLSPNRDPSQISHCSSKGLSVREVMRIENMIT